MKCKMNKKGVLPALGPIAIVIAVIIGIIFLTFSLGGGVVTIFNISKFIKSVPTFIWVVLGIIILFRLIGGKRRR